MVGIAGKVQSPQHRVVDAVVDESAPVRFQVTGDSGSQKVQHECENRLTSHLRNLLSIDGPPENSSAIDRAPGARSKSDEVSGGPSIVHEQN